MKKYAIEYKDFMMKYGVIGLAIAFIMGGATNTLVKSLVDDIIMPLVSPITPSGGWETLQMTIGPIVLNIGNFLGALLNFTIIGLVVFIIAKKILKKEEKKK